MEENKEKELRENALKDDELNDVVGGACAGDAEGKYCCIFTFGSTDVSGSTPKYKAGQNMFYTYHGNKFQAVIDRVNTRKEGFIYMEFTYSIHLVNADLSGECFEHQLSPC